ncbi:MAG: hypothetical protein HYZ36_03490 [Pedosphaera parvula]|nr:hypothetical protein [Pedosphaera parvula]
MRLSFIFGVVETNDDHDGKLMTWSLECKPGFSPVETRRGSMERINEALSLAWRHEIVRTLWRTWTTCHLT